MFSFKLIYFVIFILYLYKTKCQISDKRLCVDEHCKEPVSLAKTLQRYSSPDPLRLSFPPNVNITIYSKEAGKETSLWGAELNGKRGYIPRQMVRETKILNKPTKLVDTELTSKVPEKIIKENLEPDKVQQPFEVVDGTTLYTGAGIEPSSTETPVLSTVAPIVTKEENLDKSSEQINIAKQESSVVDDVIESMTNWLNDDKDDEDISDDEKEADQDENNEDDDDDDDNDDNEEDEEERRSSSIQANSKFKTYTLEINDATQLVDGLTQNDKQDNDQETDKVVLNNHDNNDIQGKEDFPSVTENKLATDEKLATAQLNDNLKKSSSEKLETTTLIPVEQGILPPIEQVTLPSIIVEENLTKSSLKNSENINTSGSDAENLEHANLPENYLLTNITAHESDKSDEKLIDTPNINSEQLNNKQETVTETANIGSEIINDGPIQQYSEVFNKATENTGKDIKDELPNENQDFTEVQDKVQELTNENQSIELEKNVNEAVPSPPSQFFFGQVLKPNSEEASEKLDADHSSNNILVNNEESSEVNIDQNISNESDVIINPNIIEQTEPIPQENNENSQEFNKVEEDTAPPINLSSEESGNGILSGILSFFSSDKKEEIVVKPKEDFEWSFQDEVIDSKGFCSDHDCKSGKGSTFLEEIGIHFSSDFFLYLITTAISCTTFLFVYLMVDKNRRVSPLIARINKLEKDLLVSLKENELLREQGEQLTPIIEIDTNTVPNEIVEELNRQLLDVQTMKTHLESQVLELHKELEDKQALEMQIESLEKELETSTEVGLELNRIISEMLDPENGSDRLKENVEQLQRQLLEQKDTINSINATLSEKEIENVDLISEVEMNKKKSLDLQNKLDGMIERIVQVEKERDEQQKALQNEISIYKRKYNELAAKDDALNKEIQVIRTQLSDTQRQLDLKIKEYQNLKENISNINSLQNNNEALTSIFNTVSMKAEFDQLKNESEKFAAELQQAQLDKDAYEKNCQRVLEDLEVLKQKYEDVDKDKVEANMKLEVLNNYFKKREAELQEEVLKFKSIWDAKEGETTSTTERIRLLKEEIENYKSQNETLKQEIISQEIDLKSQISVLEKKVHENWIQARQTERRLEDARQEAAQLRNRLTLRERNIDERAQNRLQSPLEQNGDLTTFSPHPIDSPASPPLLYSRDHMTKSPPVSGLPFIPPPPGAPFLPPPPLPGLPPYIPMPPPPLFPGDRRPPPLGRMSSPPPLNSRYSPDASAFSPYDRNSPSPPYDSEYGASPPPIRGYSPYRDDRRDYKRLPPPPHLRSNGRNAKGSLLSSGSDRSNESLDKINRNQSKMV